MSKITAEEIKEISGTNPRKCMKCGKCSASCPAFDEMDIKPHMFVSYVESGDIEALLASKAAYRCLSCFACLERCPRDVQPAKVIDAVRQAVIRRNSMDYLKEFLENHCEMGDYNYFTATSDLRRAYEAYCDENGTCPCSATAFNKYMEQAGGVRDRKRLTASENPVWGFYGIRLRP